MSNEFEKLTPDFVEEGMSSDVVANKSALPVNIKKDFFPMCIVWSPIPLLSWMCPVIGQSLNKYFSYLFKIKLQVTWESLPVTGKLMILVALIL